jgi:hypothetical protein
VTELNLGHNYVRMTFLVPYRRRYDRRLQMLLLLLLLQ